MNDGRNVFAEDDSLMPTGPTAAPVHVSSQSFPLSHSSFCQVGRLTPESMCWLYSDAAVGTVLCRIEW